MFKRILSLCVLCLALPAHSANDDPIKVAASFSIVADMVKQVGGDAVDVYSLVAPGVDSHTFRPTPKAVVKVKRSDLLVMNGLDFETWMPRVISASGFKGDTLVLGDVIEAIEISAAEAHHHDHHHGHHDAHSEETHDEHDHHAHKDEHKHDEHGHEHKDEHETGHHDAHDDEHETSEKVYYDPHAWQDLSKAVSYVDAISAALSKHKPNKASVFKARAEVYKKELLALDRAFKARTKDIPKSLKKVVTDHNAFAYLSRAYGVSFYAVRGLSTESDASAKDVSRVIRAMKDNDVQLIFLEAMTNTKLAKQIAKESNVKVAGTLYTGVLAPSGPASTYLGMMTHNLNALANGLESLNK